MKSKGKCYQNKKLLDRFMDNSNDSYLELSQINPQKLKSLVENTPLHWELNPFDPIIRELHDEIKAIFQKSFKTSVAVINTRAWITKPSAQKIGPNKPHKDNFPDGYFKVMVYPNGLSLDSGGIYIEGKSIITDKNPGYSIIFENSGILHAGIPGTQKERLCIEITFMKTLANFNQVTSSHVNGRSLKDPFLLYKLNKQRHEETTKLSQKRFINIGSGRRSWGANWLLLDEINDSNIHYCKINKNTLLPALTSTIDLIYSSHHIEHIDEESLINVLHESHRVMHKDAYLLLKFPAYDQFINEYLLGNYSYMLGKGIESVTWSWKSKGIKISATNFLSMMFCGYWNKAYGDHFSKQMNNNDEAYHGPAIINEKSLRRLFATRDPSFICKELRSSILGESDFYKFNHQNSWSDSQLITLVSENNFSFITKDKTKIVNTFSKRIPDLQKMIDWSTITLFKKAL